MLTNRTMADYLGQSPRDAGRDGQAAGGTDAASRGGRVGTDRVGAATASTVRRFGPQRIVVAGYGDSGRAAAATLADTGAELTVLDAEAAADVDVVGDARDPGTFTVETGDEVIIAGTDEATTQFERTFGV